MNRKRQLSSFQNIENQIYSGTKELKVNEDSLIGYSTDIVNKFHARLLVQEEIVEKQGHFLEFGAGTGFLAEIFRSRFSVTPECVELDPELLKTLEARGLKSYQFLGETKGNYSAIYTSNVLEHIESDLETLEELFRNLRTGGRLGIYVPAFPILFSEMDSIVGHVRRYRKKELVLKVQKAGFKVEHISYNDSLGFFATLIVKFIGYKSKTVNLGSQKSLAIYDRCGYPISRLLDSIGLTHIFGKNLFLIAIKE